MAFASILSVASGYAVACRNTFADCVTDFVHDIAAHVGYDIVENALLAEKIAFMWISG